MQQVINLILGLWLLCSCWYYFCAFKMRHQIDPEDTSRDEEIVYSYRCMFRFIGCVWVLLSFWAYVDGDWIESCAMLIVGCFILSFSKQFSLQALKPAHDSMTFLKKHPGVILALAMYFGLLGGLLFFGSLGLF